MLKNTRTKCWAIWCGAHPGSHLGFKHGPPVSEASRPLMKCSGPHFFVHMHKRGEENVHKHARKRSMIFENAGNNVIHTNQRFRGKQFTLAGHRFTLLIKTHPSSATLSFELAGPSLGGHIEKRQCSMSFNYKIYSWNWVSSSGFSKYQQYRSFPDRVNLCLNVVWILKMNIDVFDTTF